MTTALSEAITMGNFSIPGPCIMCGACRELRSLYDGLQGDGICEPCDELRFRSVSPRARWVSWWERRQASALRIERLNSSVSPRPRVRRLQRVP